MQHLGQIFLFCLLAQFSWGQTKLNPALYQWLQNAAEEERQPLLLKGQPEVLKSRIQACRGHWKYHIGDIAAVELSASCLRELLPSPALVRAEMGFGPSQTLHQEDSALLFHNRLLPAQLGTAPLPQAFQGQGVLVGVIDDGLEWRHPDFQHPDGSTRILGLWDQTLSLSNYLAQPYGYGSAWDSSDIAQNRCAQQASAHGSHVAGIAVGNGLAANKFSGAAPQANLLFVKNQGGAAFLPSFTDAVHYLFSQAEQQGKACVINSSLGTYFGSHDGQDLYAQAIGQMLRAKPGRVLVQAAGNARQDSFHLRANLHEGDTAFWTFDYAPSQQATFVVLFADTAQWQNTGFQCTWLNQSQGHSLGQSRPYSFDQDFHTDPLTGLKKLRDTLFWESNGQAVVLEVWLSTWGSSHEIWLWIHQSNNNNPWQIALFGQRLLADTWAKSGYTGTSNLIPNRCHPRPDNQQTIVSSWTCLPEVITVGSYQNRAAMLNYRQQTVDLSTANYPVGGISHFSSLGPTRDGRLKPDLTASGGQVLSAAPLVQLQQYRSNGYAFLDVGGWHVSNRGTSMAAPIVAGALALYLQCHPQANVERLGQVLRQTAYRDSFVAQQGALPNTDWGYGKLDATALLHTCLVYGCTDSSAGNYNPAAILDDGSCWWLPTSTEQQQAQGFALYPNPSSRYLIRHAPEPGHWQLFNAQGQCLETHQLQAGQDTWHWPEEYPAGYYFWHWQGQGSSGRGSLIRIAP